MGVMIAMGAIGVAGGIMGGMQKAKQQEAAYLQKKHETMQNNFLGQMANDRQTEAIAQSNVNRRIQDQKIYDAALENRFYASWQNQKMTADAREQVYNQSRAARASAKSQITGMQGGTGGGTSKLITKQMAKAELDRNKQISMKNYEQEQSLVQQFENQLAQQDRGIGADQSAAFIPGNLGIKPSSSGAITEGIFGGISSGLGMASGMKGLMS
jgi:hypothetical protein